MVAAGAGRIVTISMSEQTMTRRGFVPYGPSGAAVEAFRDRNQVDLVVLFPHNRVSDVQRRMMTTADA